MTILLLFLNPLVTRLFISSSIPRAPIIGVGKMLSSSLALYKLTLPLMTGTLSLFDAVLIPLIHFFSW